MQNGIVIVTILSLLSTTAPALAQEAAQTEALAAEQTAAPAPAVENTPPGAVFLGTAHAPRRKPRLDSGRIAGELLVGTATGAGLGIGTAVLLYHASDGCTGFCAFGNGLASAALGATVYPLGAGLGVSLAGHIGDQKGSTAAAVGGAYLGSLAGVLAGTLLSFGNGDSGIPFMGYLIGAPVGAAIGFNMTLKYDQPITGLVNVSDSGTRLSIPAVSVTQDPVHANRTVTSVRVIDARF